LKSIVVLVSGAGTTMKAILDASTDPGYGVRIAAVVSDRADAPALVHATAAGVPTEVVPLSAYATREGWNRALTEAIGRHTPDLVVLAGFMKILAPETVGLFSGRIINTHPALLPAFPGAHAVRDALTHGVRITGCTIHIVDAEVDTGPIVAQAMVAVEEGDTEESLHERIKVVERALVVETVRRLLVEGWSVDGRRVRFGGSKGTAS
jgi:phosphoribosylglycinamide formyltransferase-1